MARTIKRRHFQRLLKAFDKWALVARGNSMKLVGASRALQILYSPELRLLQRSFIRLRGGTGYGGRLVGQERHYFRRLMWSYSNRREHLDVQAEQHRMALASRCLRW